MKAIKIHFAVLGGFMLMSSSFVFAEQAGTVTYIEGRVDRYAGGGEAYFPVVVGETIGVGDALRTKTYSKAELTLVDGSVLRLGDNSLIRIEKYTMDTFGHRKGGVIHLDRGILRAIVAKSKSEAPFDITTPNAAGFVKGSDIFVSFLKSSTSVLVKEGTFAAHHVNFPDKIVEVSKGKALLVPYDGPPVLPREYLAVEKSKLESQTGPTIRESVEVTKDREMTRAVVMKISGSVRVQPNHSKDWHLPNIKEVLYPGDKIETGENGSVEISLDNGHIIELRPKTQMMIRILSRNPKTGEYKNLFESEFGRIRAKLRQITPGSSFEVQTPTAVCGVRGTIMYLIISATVTKAFFEGGDGYIYNQFSQATKTVYAGMTASSDDQGNITEPANTTSEERSEFGQDWGSDSGDPDEYGYSNPDPNEEGDVPPPGGNEGGNNTNMTGGDTGNNNQPFNVVPPNVNGPTTPSEEPAASGMNARVNGVFGSYDTLLNMSGESIKASMSVSDTTNLWNGASGVEVKGTVENSEGGNLWGGNVSGESSDGGNIEGTVAGTWHSWEGLMAGFFIDPSGMAGAMLGLMGGDTGPEDSTFLGRGVLESIPVEPISIPPSSLAESIVHTGPNSGRMAGQFSEGYGSFDFEFKREYFSITGGADWGISRSVFSGYYNNSDGDLTWQGTFFEKMDEGTGYAVGLIQGSDDGDAILRTQYEGIYLDYEKMILYSGNTTGLYESGYGEWGGEGEGYYGYPNYEGVGVALIQIQPLSFSGKWGTEYTSLYYNDGGNMTYAGTERGLIGAVTLPWDGSGEYMALGEYDTSAGEGRYLWHTPVESFNQSAGLPTALDGGAFYGFTTGIWDKESMDGSLFGIYMDPDQETGLIVGDVEGSYDPNSAMWRAEGGLETKFVELRTDIAPEDFRDNIESESFDMNLAGYFGNREGFIYGSSVMGSYFVLGGKETGNFMWGILGLRFGSEDIYDNPEGSTEWTGYIWSADPLSYDLYTVQGTWVDGLIYGDLTGIELMRDRMATLEGKFYGLFDEEESGSGTWIGTTLAVSQDQWLSFNGLWGGDDGSDGALYINNNGNLDQVGASYGLFGAVSSPWQAPADYLAMGQYGYEADPQPMLFNTTFESSCGGSITQDGGAFFGVTAGTIVNGAGEGSLYALYMDPDHNVGILKGTISGDFYDLIGMWSMEGTLTAEKFGEMPELDPEDLLDVIVIDPFVEEDGSAFFGSFGAGSGSVVAGSDEGENYSIGNYEDALWNLGTVRFGKNNTYSNPENETQWTGGIREVYNDFAQLLWIDGSWENEIIRGQVSGQAIDLDYGRLENVSGDFYGIYEEGEEGTGTWVGTAIAAATVEPMTFSGFWSEEGETIYENDNGTLVWAGSDFGLIGGASSPWNAPADYLMIGEFQVPENPAFAGVWNTTIESASYDQSDEYEVKLSTTMDGGAFFGVTGGLIHDGLLDGSIYALYMDPDRNAGFLIGDASGNFYPDIQMATAGGTLQPFAIGPILELGPESFLDTIYPRYFEEEESSLFGIFNEDGGSIIGGPYSGTNYSVGDLEEAYGNVMELRFGEYGGNSYFNPQNGTQWTIWNAYQYDGFAVLDVFKGNWENGLMQGSGGGTAIRLASGDILRTYGDVYGTYEATEGNAGTWAGVCVGYETREDIAFSGIIGDPFCEGANQSLYYNDGGNLENAGNTGVGLVAGVNSPWTAPSEFVAIGSHEIMKGTEPYLWFTPAMSYNYPSEKWTTMDGGAFYGGVASQWVDGEIGSFLVGIYIDPLGNVGRLFGDFTGSYYDAIGMWMLEGTLTAVVKDETGIDPEDFSDYVRSSELEMVGQHGGFEDGGWISSTWTVRSIDYENLDGNDWGVWGTIAAGIYGIYQQVSSPEWSIPFVGYDGEDGPLWDGPYILGLAEGDDWTEGNFTGDVKGVWIGGPEFDEEGHAGINMDIGTMTGQVEGSFKEGSFEIEGEEWQAVGAGEWVEVEELVDLTDLAEVTTSVFAVANLINLPITEVVNITDVTGSGGFNAGGTLTAQMDMNLYAISQTAQEGIWAALIHDGVWNGLESNDWAMQFINGADQVQLNGFNWSNGLWNANVTGSVNGNDILGQAAGNYAQTGETSGTFQGIASGVWGDRGGGGEAV
ncbi:MAG: FecR domain-containing protein [Candidatus Omnitrophica bacterium]|nr:FecR domain-containing protein [Candidatus Omnitrophota bacterium]